MRPATKSTTGRSAPSRAVDKRAQASGIPRSPAAAEIKESNGSDEIRVWVDRKTRLQAGLSYFHMGRAGNTLSGPALGLATQYGLSPTWGVGAEFQHGLSTSPSLSSAYSALEARLVVALTGSLILPGQRALSSGASDAPITPNSPGGFRALLSVEQYFFAGSSTLLLFGAGLAVNYEFPSQSWYNFFVGVKAERISGEGNVIYPVRFEAGARLWL